MQLEQKNSFSSSKEKGQLTIFLAICLTIIIGLLAFIVNVGLFVKAKINLQNAVDAAAYAGASVQARQLTNISYLNWEIRNVYKEWMFKYYVLGQLGIRRTSPERINSSPYMNFRMRTFDAASGRDPLNIPSICIHYGSPNNICDIFDVPGLPRFENPGIPGISERLEQFIDRIRDVKSTACADRSLVNQTTAILWTFGVGREADPFQGIPLVLGQRPGAWPQALELSFRMRNLEAIVNRSPLELPICPDQYTGDQECIPISSPELVYGDVPMNERPMKAFMSAYRNLSGGNYKNRLDDEFSRSFTLTELAPNPYIADPNSLSGLLIPPGRAIRGSKPALEKYYLDLEINPVNYAIFYTAFTPKTQDSAITTVQQEGACQSTRTAIPVPGYVMGFTKSPRVMTYYAVRGEANYKGLFFPFFRRSPDGIRLSAYSVAKPFGGRIGPKRFETSPNLRGLRVRPAGGAPSSRTAPYIMGLNTANINDNFILLPNTQQFWLTQAFAATSIGGTPQEITEQPRFGIPNMPYDFSDVSEMLQATLPTVGNIEEAFHDPQVSVQQRLGLYNSRQFRYLRDNLTVEIPTSGTVAQGDLVNSIFRARRPTHYDALNYMIPTPDQNGSDTPGVVVPRYGDHYELYAPLLDPDGALLYNEIADLTSRSIAYIRSSESAIDLYTNSLRDVAREIDRMGEIARQRAQPQRPDAAVAYQDASKRIYNGTRYDGRCESLSQAFHFFFLGEAFSSACGAGMRSLSTIMTTYFANIGDSERRRKFYMAPFAIDDRINYSNFHTGFMPGTLEGSTSDGLARRPFAISGGTVTQPSRRNFYSTKFVSLANVLASRLGDSTSYRYLSLLSERDTVVQPAGVNLDPNQNFRNTLPDELVGDFIQAQMDGL